MENIKSDYKACGKVSCNFSKRFKCYYRKTLLPKGLWSSGYDIASTIHLKRRRSPVQNPIMKIWSGPLCASSPVVKIRPCQGCDPSSNFKIKGFRWAKIFVGESLGWRIFFYLAIPMKENKEKKKWWLILFIIFITIGTSVSFVLFDFQPQNDVIKYNGMKFVKYADRWEAKINGNTAAFSLLPNEVESVAVSGDSIKMLQDKYEIDFTYDQNSTYKESIALAQHQMGLTLAAYNIYLRKGFTSNNTYEIPIITCKDSTANVPVVYFTYGNSTNIHAEDNCIVAEAKTNADFTRLKDRILYGILRVI